MTAIFVLAHAPLATAFLQVAKHVYPDCSDRLTAIDVVPDSDIIAIEQHLRAALAKHGGQEILLLVDVVGASPCNAAAKLSDLPNVGVVVGLNVSMLWRVLCYSSEPLDALINRAIDGAKVGVQQVFRTKPQSLPLRRDNHAHDENSGQQ